MDMGDILAQWETMKADEKKKQKDSGKANVVNGRQISHKKANAPTAQEKAAALAAKEQKDFAEKIRQDSEKQINPMEMWLRRYGTVDKDKIAEETAERTREQDRNYLISMRPEAHLDLHGLHQDEARERLNNFISDCKRRGIRKVMIIHGKGIHTHGTDPVLGELVRRFIETDNRCGMSGHPKNKADGGTGATWVILK